MSIFLIEIVNQGGSYVKARSSNGYFLVLAGIGKIKREGVVAMRSAMRVTRDSDPQIIPLLNNGDRLTQREFHRRYEAYPDDVKFELIGGIVYMASPTGWPHSKYHLQLATVLGNYEAATPGVEGLDNATTILGPWSEPQPDLALRILPERGGQSFTP